MQIGDVQREENGPAEMRGAGGNHEFRSRAHKEMSDTFFVLWLETEEPFGD